MRSAVTIHSRFRGLLCALGALALGTALAGGAGEEPVVVAEFLPAAASTWLGWRCSIYDDGYAERSIRDSATEGRTAWRARRVPRIRPSDLQRVWRKTLSLIRSPNREQTARLYRD